MYQKDELTVKMLQHLKFFLHLMATVCSDEMKNFTCDLTHNSFEPKSTAIKFFNI